MAKKNAKTEEAEAPQVDKKAGDVYVTTEFHDKDNYDQLYEVGQNVTEKFKGERLAYLIEQGVIEVYQPAKAEEPAA